MPNITRRGFFDYATLGIALIGACTGVYASYKEWIKPSQIDLQINYNKDNSVVASINSDNPYMNGKLAVLMYGLVLAGYGQNPFYPRQINMSVRCKGSLKTASQIIPTKYKAKSVDMEYVAIYRIGLFEHRAVFDWEDFKEDKKGLSLGEPYTFSYAGLLDLNKDDFNYCDKIYITVKDYLDNIIEKSIDARPLARNKDFILCMKLLEKCEADSKSDFERLKHK